MVDPDRRPTAQEIEELIDLVRRDPASPAFIDLGEAYLSLGRPRDAIQVGNLGLEAAPDSLEGRVMLARAYAALHQWKEAQGELLRVVKVDRSNRQGFALLGEVLLRRNDFERAVPVLQHAQNLDPTSPAILSMLRRARAGQPLDPPSPVPQPIPPRGEPGAEVQRPGRPTAHAKPRPSAPVAQQQPPPMPMPHAPASNAVAPTMALPPSPMYPPPPPQMMSAPPFPDASSGNRAPKQTAPPPMSIEGVKPRLVQNAKPQNAAQASLRQSAAVGENYLNDLLTGGLLDVAGVRVPEVEYDLRPDRRWGRSTRRAFIFLFVVLVFGVGGGGGWYWWSEKQKREAVATMQRESRAALGNADYTNIVDAIKLIQTALDKDGSDKLSMAYYVEACGLAALLYGEAFVPNPKEPTKEIAVGIREVDHFFKGIASGEDPITPEQPGYREMMIGKAAAELSRLPTGLAAQAQLEAASAQLQSVNKDLDALLDKDKNDRWARYLKGRALLAVGDTTTAAQMFKLAGEGDGGLLVAVIDQANVLVDQGKIDEALPLFKKVLDKSKDHPLALIGEAIAKGEASITPGDVIGELNAKFVIDKLPSRVAAWRWLALAGASITNDDYKAAAEAVLKSKAGSPPSDPRFWSRVAWIHIKLGRPAKDKQKSDVEAARDARKHCVWFVNKLPTKDPTVALVDAGLDLAGGLPDRTIEAASKLDGIRPKLLRTYALLDLGKAEEAMKLSQEIVRLAPEPTGTPCEAANTRANLEARTLCEQARMLSTQGKERVKASEELTSLASASKNQIPRYALGVSFLALKDQPPVDTNIGPNLDYAKKQLKKAYEDIAEDRPNPLLYRTLTALAEVAVNEKDLDAARDWHKKALEANADYRPARAVGARIYLRAGDAEKALEEIDGVLAEVVSTDFLLTKAEALVSRKKVSADDKEEAKKLLGMLKDRPNISAEELGRIAALIDPKAPEELGLPSPDSKVKDDKKGPKRPGKAER